MVKRFTQDHEWIKVKNSVAEIGITDFAIESLGDLVFIELPDVGTTVEKGDDFSVVESVKAASEIYSPVKGEIVEVNDALSNDPELLKEGQWIVKIKIEDEDDLESLMSEEEYKGYLEDI